MINYPTLNLIKSVLAILFLICLLDMPYGYFQLVRFAALVGFVILAYQADQQNHKKEMVAFICLAILFQPLLKIPLGRQFWNVVDVIVAVVLLGTIFVKPSQHEQSSKHKHL